MPRFVILVHDHPFLHWDFMLEVDAVLRTWRLLDEPNSSGEIAAEPLPVHRKHYLDYEGPVSNGRGTVRCWDCGDYTLVQESLTKIFVQLEGQKLNGLAVLECDVDKSCSFSMTAN